MSQLLSVDARTGAADDAFSVAPTTDAELAGVTSAATAATSWLHAAGRAGRAALLDALAGSLEARGDEIVEVADRESGLGAERLRGELARTCFQLRFMGEVATEGSYLDVVIDHPGSTPAGPRPDLRRTSVPLGPVAIFGASNFPLAFGAPGGDTASAIAAGCPVVVKAHESNLQTSTLVRDAFRDAIARAGAPEGVFQLVFGRAAGPALVRDPRIFAVGFTGSLAGGRALFDIAAARDTPIPFYGELGSVNPLVITPAAAASRAEEIGAGIAASMTLGVGQFCTKPGLFLVPSGAAGDSLIGALVAEVREVDGGYLLNPSIDAAFRHGMEDVFALEGIDILYSNPPADRRVSPVLVEVSIAKVLEGDEEIIGEHFGPFGIVVRYSSIAELAKVLAALPPALTGTAHVGVDDEDAAAVTALLEGRSGRVVFNGYPTGVSVAWGMHHGGPYPATTSTFSSVGASSIKRWIRPVTYQNAPDSILPPELSGTAPPRIPRRIDGRLVVG